MRIDVYEMHGKDHSETPGSNGCGCIGEPGLTTGLEVACLPPVGSGIWLKGASGWREVTVERYTFGDPKNPARILAWASYNREE